MTCGEAGGLRCSHFYPRRYLRTRFDLRNCDAMCAACNRRHNVDPGPYLLFRWERYGEMAVAEWGRVWEGQGGKRRRPSVASN